jgi:hypothetical protein
MRIKAAILTGTVLTVFMLSRFVWAEVPAFPGAEGFGAQAKGGRGGKVLLVTSLEDKGPGTLREACEAEGPRIVVFRVSGLIDLKSDLRIRNPYITIAGQTAPGAGICLKTYCLNIKETHDVVVRHIRIRPGDVAGKELDGVTADKLENCIFDHCSVSWAIDETLSVTQSKNVTVQWCLVSESLNKSLHKKGEHGYGSLVSGYDGGITWAHSIYAHHKSRSPRAGATEGTPGIIFDFRNNVIYDWSLRAGYSGDSPVRMNYVGNYLKPGPSTPNEKRGQAFALGAEATKVYMDGNQHEGAWFESCNQTRLLVRGDRFSKDSPISGSVMNEPFPAPPVATTCAAKSYEAVLNDAGATLPRRDATDARIIEDIRSGKGHIINSQTEVGGWCEYASETPPQDTDGDGMPDDWETQHGLNPSDPADNAGDRDGDGYTNIEECINP